ncbi:MAG: dephospho-CoA kinase [Anaerolineales bacterium]
MSHWPGKYVIGLTGNIATGKSVVRKMLEHLGAYSIDADALSHRAIARGAPGYQPVIDTFGRWVLDAEGQIDRAKLGKLVFADPEALAKLEAIIHPLVGQAVDVMVKRATQPVIVIEAIKLLEGKLKDACDAIWVTDAPQEVQIRRLVEKRGLSPEEALQRVQAQNAQEVKKQAAHVIITNDGSIEATWKQVQAAWKSIGSAGEAPAEPTPQVSAGELSVTRGRPRDSAAIAELITTLSNGAKKLTPDDIMDAFGEKAFMLLKQSDKPVGVAGWQVENLVSRTTDFFLAPNLPLEAALGMLVREIEKASADLQSEASLLFLPPDLARHEATWKQLGYERRTPQSLGVQAWTDAANESAQPNTTLFFKQLRTDRVLRPI